MNLKEEKTALRARYRAEREAIPQERRRLYDRAIREGIAESDLYQAADLLLAYAPIGAEIDLMPLLLAALQEGRRVALPRTHGNGVMTFHEIRSEEDLVACGRYGIREPREDAPLYRPSPHALILVPGIAFDREGFRIGYGGGYYDRFLSVHQGRTLGITYHELILPTLPHDTHDVAVCALATECGILPTTRP